MYEAEYIGGYYKMIQYLKKNTGIEVRGSFIFALPGESPELAAQTIQDAINPKTKPDD